MNSTIVAIEFVCRQYLLICVRFPASRVALYLLFAVVVMATSHLAVSELITMWRDSFRLSRQGAQLLASNYLAVSKLMTMVASYSDDHKSLYRSARRRCHTVRCFCTRAIRFSREAYTTSSRACEAKNSNKAFYMSITLQDNGVCAFRLNNIGFD